MTAVERVEIVAGDGVAPCTAAGDVAAAGVLMLSDGHGVRPVMHELASRLAAAGYRVLLPDLFYRRGPHSEMTFPAMMRDVAAYLDWFGGAPVSVVGYCMGGRLALVAAATFPDRLAACAAYHPGRLVTDAADSPHRILDRIRAAVYLGAASNDAQLTDAQRETVAAALRAGGVDHTIEVYAAGHGFVPADAPAHDPGAAARHWVTLLALLARVELCAMIARDDDVRARLAADGSLFDGYHPEMEAVHRASAARLRELVARDGWPAHPAAAEAAWRILQHAIGEPETMRALAPLVTDPRHRAMLDDRIRVFEGRPQRYGTQLDWDDTGTAMVPMVGVEDPDGVDARRAAVGLPPLVWRQPPPRGERPPKDRAARAAEADAWARRVGWR